MTPQERADMVTVYMEHGGEISFDLALDAAVGSDSYTIGKVIAFAGAAVAWSSGVHWLVGGLVRDGAGAMIAGAFALYAAYRCRQAARWRNAVHNAYMQRESLRRLLGS